MKEFKSFARITSLALIICLLLTFASCSSDKDKDSYSDLFGAMSQYYDTSDTSSAIPKITTRLVVIIPAGCSAGVFDSAQKLAAAFSERADTEVKVKYDSDYKASSKETEILVGATDRMASADFLKILRVNDYGYGYDSGKIVVTGRTDFGCSEAVRIFLEDISSGVIDISNARSIENKIIRSNYAIEKITLGGFELSEYAIVYPEANVHNEKKIAEKLSQSICGLGGYVLPTISDNELADSTRGICVGKTSVSSSVALNKSTSIILGQTGHIELLAEDEYGLSLASDKLIEMIWNCKIDKVCKVDIEKRQTFDYDSTDIKLFIINEALGEADLDTYRNTANMISAEAPSIAVFHDCTEAVLKNLEGNLGKIDSLGGRVFYRMADGVRFVDGKIENVEDGAVYILTFETDNGGSALCWSLVGVIEPSKCEIAQKKELYAYFSVFCTQALKSPTVALFGMPDYLEEMLLADVDGMEKKGDGYYINSCGGTFFGNDRRHEDISSDLVADVIETVIYFNK